MASTVSSVPGGSDVSLVRLYVMRAICLVFIVQGCFAILPDIMHPDLTRRGMLDSMLAGLWVRALLFGLRYPLQMIPLFLFEFVWKTLWLIDFGLPQWLSGTGAPRLKEDLLSIVVGPIVFGLIIPWGYVYRRYVKQPADRWR